MAGIDKIHPALAAEWHPTLNTDLSPADVSAGSGRKVWWICTLHHAWQDTPGHRCGRGSGCPFCVGKRVLVGFNDLAHTHRLVAAEWHPHRNGDLTPEAVSAGSSRKVWWQDDLDHEWHCHVSDEALYEATRGPWTIAEHRREIGAGTTYALAIFKGIVRAAYAIEAWEPVPPETGKPPRWSFTGRRDPDVEARYVGKNVSTHLTSKRFRLPHPVIFVNE